MRTTTVIPTGVERTFGSDEIIVSKTDSKGVLTYANDVFCRMAAAPEEDLIGQPHNVVRHPEMPRAVFKYMWNTISKGREVFAYVQNLGLDGTHYWVFAHVTASGRRGEPITGYHSNRRAPSRSALAVIDPLYRRLREVERSHASSKEGLEASMDTLFGMLEERDMTYDEFVWSVTP